MSRFKGLAVSHLLGCSVVFGVVAGGGRLSPSVNGCLTNLHSIEGQRAPKIGGSQLLVWVDGMSTMRPARGRVSCRCMRGRRAGIASLIAAAAEDRAVRSGGRRRCAQVAGVGVSGAGRGVGGVGAHSARRRDATVR